MMIVREFREAWGRLERRPGYAELSVAMLGVGLGGVMFLFSMVNPLILPTLPFPTAQRCSIATSSPMCCRTMPGCSRR